MIKTHKNTLVVSPSGGDITGLAQDMAGEDAPAPAPVRPQPQVRRPRRPEPAPSEDADYGEIEDMEEQ